jgi:hypothetical protein
MINLMLALHGKDYSARFSKPGETIKENTMRSKARLKSHPLRPCFG